jgi:inner membrane protein
VTPPSTEASCIDFEQQGGGHHLFTAVPGRRRRFLASAPVVAFVTIVVIDVALGRRSWPLVVVAILDEPAHLLTAALFLGVLTRRPGDARWLWALCGSVAIDLDHVPLYTFAPDLAVSGRPPTHSLLTVLVLWALAAVPVLRTPMSGLALGVLLHLVRDVATGPGVPLLWPVSGTAVRAPHLAYLGLLGLVTCLSTVRLHRALGDGRKSHA